MYFAVVYLVFTLPRRKIIIIRFNGDDGNGGQDDKNDNCISIHTQSCRVAFESRSTYLLFLGEKTYTRTWKKRKFWIFKVRSRPRSSKENSFRVNRLIATVEKKNIVSMRRHCPVQSEPRKEEKNLKKLAKFISITLVVPGCDLKSLPKQKVLWLVIPIFN